MLNIGIQFFGGRGGGGTGGARGGRAGGGGGKTSMTNEQTLSVKDLTVKGNHMSPALMQATQQANNLNNVGDYIEVERTMKDGSVEVSRMTVTGTAKYNDVYYNSPDPSNPDIPTVTTTSPGRGTQTHSSVIHRADLMNLLLDKRSKTKSVTIKTYKKG